jgi:hypothetical protein
MCSVRCTCVVLIPILIQASGCADPKKPVSSASPPATSRRPRDTSAPFSTQEGTTITLHPSGITFKIPVDWATWNSKHENNLHLSVDQLARVEKPPGDEWDREFAQVCNASLPFDRCAAHVGSEGWGMNSHRYNDLQVRVYDLLDSPGDLEDRIVKAATAVAKVDEAKRELGGAWRRLLVKYRRFHFDYGATAFVDFRLRQFRDRTIVFVFMYTHRSDSGVEIQSILHSARGD